MGDNMFSGFLPPEIGLMVGLENITLSQNFLSGTLPAELGVLTSLSELALNTNNILLCATKKLAHHILIIIKFYRGDENFEELFERRAPHRSCRARKHW